MEGVVTIAEGILPLMGVRMYFRAKMEADDLIYAFTKTMQPKESATIVSSDSDFAQLERGSVHVFNPMHTGHRREYRHPILMKCLMGDKADNVEGYAGIGPIRASRLCEDKASLMAFLKDKGVGVLRKNRVLIDLSQCPFTAENVAFVQAVRALRVCFDADAIKRAAMTLKVRGLIAAFDRYVLPFRDLVHTECCADAR
jgi:hypothetical protein